MFAVVILFCKVWRISTRWTCFRATGKPLCCTTRVSCPVLECVRGFLPQQTSCDLIGWAHSRVSATWWRRCWVELCKRATWWTWVTSELFIVKVERFLHFVTPCWFIVSTFVFMSSVVAHHCAYEMKVKTALLVNMWRSLPCVRTTTEFKWTSSGRDNYCICSIYQRFIFSKESAYEI